MWQRDHNGIKSLSGEESSVYMFSFPVSASMRYHLGLILTPVKYCCLSLPAFLKQESQCRNMSFSCGMFLPPKNTPCATETAVSLFTNTLCLIKTGRIIIYFNSNALLNGLNIKDDIQNQSMVQM